MSNNVPGGFQCSCPPGFLGKNIIFLLIKNFNNGPCGQNGQCSITPQGNAFCICNPGFTGATCDICDPCTSNPVSSIKIISITSFIF